MDVCMLQKPRLEPLFALAALMAALTPQATLALDGQFEIGTAAEHSSNVFRTSSDEQSDTLNSLLANASVNHSSAELGAKLQYSFEKRHYQDGSYDNENVTDGGANIDWRILDDRISLLVDHSISDSIISNSAPNTPSNRTQRSVLSAGPRFRFHVSQIDNVELTARHTDVNVDALESDSKRDEATLQWNRRLPQLRNVHFTTSYSNITFPDQENQDYKFTTAAIGFNSASAIGTFSAEVGANRADRDILDDVTGKSLNISWNSRTDRSPVHWSISYVSAITDSSLGLSGEAQTSLPSGGTGASSNLAVIDIVKRDELGLTVSAPISPIATTVILTASEEKEDYDQALNDDRTDRIGLTLLHPITPRADIYVYTDKVKQDFLDTDQDMKDTEVGIGGSYIIIKSLNLRWSAYRLKRDSSEDVLSFTDNVYRLEVAYGFGFGTSAETSTMAAKSSATARPSRGR